VSSIKFKNFDVTMFMNGILGGLVGITAGADLMSPLEAIIIGLLSGALVVLAVSWIDRLKLDDPVGAVAVHLFCGIWGTLAVGIFGDKAGWFQLLYQFIGVLIIGIFCSLFAYLIAAVVNKTVGLRVGSREEVEGLDIHEHGMDAYADFGLNDH
jgi:Amt family ammonium transporter